MITILKDRVLIARLEPTNTTPTGIILPDSQKKIPDRGTVITTGPQCHPMLQADSTVIFQKFAGTEIEHEGKKYLIMREDEILAIL
jgi:chaperonin GroES